MVAGIRLFHQCLARVQRLDLATLLAGIRKAGREHRSYSLAVSFDRVLESNPGVPIKCVHPLKEIP